MVLICSRLCCAMDNNDRKIVTFEKGNASVPLMPPLPRFSPLADVRQRYDFFTDEQIAKEAQLLEEQLAFARKSLQERHEHAHQVSYDNYELPHDPLQNKLQDLIAWGSGIKNKIDVTSPVVICGAIATTALFAHYYIVPYFKNYMPEK